MNIFHTKRVLRCQCRCGRHRVAAVGGDDFLVGFEATVLFSCLLASALIVTTVFFVSSKTILWDDSGVWNMIYVFFKYMQDSFETDKG